MTLAAFPVSTVFQVQQMRRIRNRCAAGFAHFNGWISPGQQQKWWRGNRANLRAWLYSEDVIRPIYGPPVGFGLLTRHDDGIWWATVGVSPECQGHNYGKQIMLDLVSKADGPVYSAARKDNPPALRLHTEDAWEVTGEDERLFFFRARAAVTA